MLAIVLIFSHVAFIVHAKFGRSQVRFQLLDFVLKNQKKISAIQSNVLNSYVFLSARNRSQSVQRNFPFCNSIQRNVFSVPISVQLFFGRSQFSAFFFSPQFGAKFSLEFVRSDFSQTCFNSDFSILFLVRFQRAISCNLAQVFDLRRYYCQRDCV